MARREQGAVEEDGEESFHPPVRRVLVILAALAFALAAGGAAAPMVLPRLPNDAARMAYGRLFGMDAEQSVPTWLSVLLLAAVSVLSAWLATRRRVVRADRRGWWILAVAFAYLSMDEQVGLHELANAPLRRALDLDGVLYYGWPLLAAACLLVFGLVMFRFWLRQEEPLRRRLLLAGVVYIAGGMGMELVGGWLDSRGMYQTAPYVAAASVEELLEMLGALLAIDALLAHPALRDGVVEHA